MRKILKAFQSKNIRHFICVNYLDSGGDEVLRDAILGSDDMDALFYMTFASSILSASIGTTKSLKIGMAAITADDGPSEGLCLGRYLVALGGKYHFHF